MSPTTAEVGDTDAATLAAAERVGALLVRTSFPDRVEATRRAGFATYQPWPPELDGSDDDRPAGGSAGASVTPDLGHALRSLLNHGVVRRECFTEELWHDLCALGLAEAPAQPGTWELTAHRGLIAARDRPSPTARGQVHIGEDSLRFAESILGVSPRGVALDVGSGSGISTVALGRTCREVHAIDVVPECLRATQLSMALNGMGPKARVSDAQLDAFEPSTPYDCAIGNLPGVPVPPGLAYPPDGAGGPDGLSLMRLFLQRCRSTLVHPGGVVIMRFQSLGDERGPLLLDELRELAPAAGWDVSVLTESRIAAEVRAALTAHHALPVNPGSEPSAMLARTDAHLAATGYREYFASTLFARPGAGSVTYTDLSVPSLVHRPLRAVGAGGVDVARAIVPAYYGLAHDLPDSFWELGSMEYIYEPVARLEAILDVLAGGATVPELIERVFAAEVAADPIRARFLYVTVELLLGCLLHAGLLAPAG